MSALNLQATPLVTLNTHTISLLNHITSFLSTLPLPIEPVEDILSTGALTNSLLQSLLSQIQRFNLSFHPQLSFLNPLVQDNLFALQQLESLVLTARKSRIWENSSNCNSNSASVAWILICGGEDNAIRLRNRFFVEKYRVRVLIDVVTWYGLRLLNSRTEEQEREFQGVRNRLPMVAERMVGVWRDYQPKLKELESRCLASGMDMGVLSDPREEERRRAVMGRRQRELMNPVFSTPAPVRGCPPKYEALSPATTTTIDEKLPLKASVAISSPPPQTQPKKQIKFETYLLRQTPATKYLQSSTRILGVPISKTHGHTQAVPYIKHLPSTSEQISSFLQTSLENFTSAHSRSEEEHSRSIRRVVLGMDDDAQREIQKLIERREGEGGGEWELCGLVERLRRKISSDDDLSNSSSSTSNSSSSNCRGKRRLWRFGKKEKSGGEIEWVLVLRGERDLPAPVQPVQVGSQNSRPEKKTMTVEEAERKLDGMVGDLFRFVSTAPVNTFCRQGDDKDEAEAEAEDSESEDEDEDDEDEDEERDD